MYGVAVYGGVVLRARVCVAVVCRAMVCGDVVSRILVRGVVVYVNKNACKASQAGGTNFFDNVFHFLV